MINTARSDLRSEIKLYADLATPLFIEANRFVFFTIAAGSDSHYDGPSEHGNALLFFHLERE